VSASELHGESTGRREEIRAVPVRHPGRWVATVIVLIIAASLIRSAATNPNFGWSIVRKYLFDSRITHGVVVTIELTVIAMVIGAVLGIMLAVMRLSPNPVVKAGSWLYIYFFRGTPVYVQLLFWGFFGALYKYIDIGVPFGGPALIHASSNTLISEFRAAILGLGLNEGAYMAEIVRAGLISVDEGQTEAANALGMSRIQTMRRIVLPQAMRVIIPPTGNETISMLKTTSLVVAIGGVYELLFETQQIYAANYKPIPLLIAASIWYLALTSVLYVGQYFIERHFGRGFSRAEQGRMRARWLDLESGNASGTVP
jgi:polar amino acid transport system permease protein